MKKWVASLPIALGMLWGAAGAECLDGDRPTTPSHRFVVTATEAHDTRTGLTWARCPAGMRLQQERCTGSLTLMTWPEARAHARRIGGGWRLPTIDELMGIVERRCRNPAIDAEVFPGVVTISDGQAKYWSRTPFRDLPGMFHNVDFMDGTVDANSRGISMGVRLVRGPG